MVHWLVVTLAVWGCVADAMEQVGDQRDLTFKIKTNDALVVFVGEKKGSQEEATFRQVAQDMAPDGGIMFAVAFDAKIAQKYRDSANAAGSYVAAFTNYDPETGHSKKCDANALSISQLVVSNWDQACEGQGVHGRIRLLGALYLGLRGGVALRDKDPHQHGAGCLEAQPDRDEWRASEAVPIREVDARQGPRGQGDVPRLTSRGVPSLSTATPFLRGLPPAVDCLRAQCEQCS